jgi:hypothetical protein
MNFVFNFGSLWHRLQTVPALLVGNYGYAIANFIALALHGYWAGTFAPVFHQVTNALRALGL